MSEHKVFAVMGSPGSGKTTASVKLALELAKHKKNVIAVFCDPFTPVIPYILPADTAVESSLGTLLTAPGLTQKNILDACLPITQSEYISLLGYKAGESLMSYPKITKDKTIDFFVMLRHLADYVIIDCSAVFEADPVSIVAIETADITLRLGTANLKGISYFQTHMPMLADSVFRAAGHIKAISPFKPGQEWEAVAQQYGGTEYVLPYAPELEKQFDEAALFEPLTAKDSMAYTAEIEKVSGGVFGLKGIPVKAEPSASVLAVKPKGKGSFSIKLPFGKRKGEF